MKSYIEKFNSVENRIIDLRGQKVILDYNVAALYGVETREINQAVKNNPEKFPDGYIINIEKQEFINLRSNFLIANNPNRRMLPKAFTEMGLYIIQAHRQPQKRQKTSTPPEKSTTGAAIKKERALRARSLP